MGPFADEGQEPDVPPSLVTSSLILACECSFVIEPVHHYLWLWFFWAACEQSVHGFQPCNSKDSQHAVQDTPWQLQYAGK